ncbi:MAG: serine/threonine-protein kinase [Myxococcota bacterium]
MSGATSYTFVKCLGRGGFGEVYLANRRNPEGIERRVAVKMLRSDLSDTDLAIARLKDEGKLLALLDHPGIVRVLELTRLGGQVALVTEYIDGIDLSRFCVSARRLPLKVVVSAIGEVAGALDCAHTTVSPETGKPLRLVHRDVKPENVRLSRHGEAKLLDFGIARSPEVSRQARTTTGNLPFTPGYTAPEAFVSLRQEPATDVFALGATAFRLLVTERFYEGVRLAEQASLSCAPARYGGYLEGRLYRLPPETGPEVTELLRRCLAYDPGDRPTARQLMTKTEAMAEQMEGPTLRRFVRESPLPEERPIEDAPLIGRTLAEDRPGETVSFERPVRGGRASAPTEVVSRSPQRSTEPAPTTTQTMWAFPWLVMGFSLLLAGGFAVVLAAIAFATGLWMGG